MKRFFWIAPVGLLLGAGTLAAAQGKKEDKPPVVTLKGQVIDFACYFTMNALGGDHQQCAEMCVKGSATTGFKTKDKTYVVIHDPMHQKDAPNLVAFVNKEAEVTGNEFTRDGVQGLKILTIK